jgi:hypothetical protein
MMPSMRRRVYRRAALAWLASRPHQALEILTAAGLAREWPTFQRVAFRLARERFLRRMPPVA